MLTSKQRAYLQALAHDLKPVILLGHKGVSEAVIKETRAALHAHELIKARVHDDGTLDADAEALATGAAAELVARVGRVVILYKQHPEKPTIKLPTSKTKKALFEL